MQSIKVDWTGELYFISDGARQSTGFKYIKYAEELWVEKYKNLSSSSVWNV